MIRSVWFGLVTVAASAWFSTLAIAGGLFRAPHRWYDRVHRGWARALLRAAGVRVEVVGLENFVSGGPRILVANHQSTFDILALFAALPVSIRFVAKRELARIPLFAGAMRAAGHVFIDRGDRRRSVEAIRAAEDRMRREGFSLGLFPEGTRSRDGALREFKKGSIVLAIETQLPLVPVAIDGGWRLVSRGRLRPGPVRIRIADSVPTAGRTAGDRDEVLRTVREEVRRLLAETRREAGDPTPLEPRSGAFRAPDPERPLTDGPA
ncbi:MAG: lysophospholipid acyltransferase family protein [Gemmatimonadota bacterium]